MAQQHFIFDGVQIKDPTEYSVNLATTSTASSGRTQKLVMKNVVVGTVQSYSFKWKTLTPAEMSAILTAVLDKPKFTATYFDIVRGAWTTGDFYATTFNAPCKILKEGIECWDELSFNIISINPVSQTTSV